jgi:Fructose-2,6-bisphosphatase
MHKKTLTNAIMEITRTCEVHHRIIQKTIQHTKDRDSTEILTIYRLFIPFANDINLQPLRNNMTVKITYFVHGTTTDNQKEISSGWHDVDLSDLGVEQSIKLIDQINDKKFDVVFCSDLKRAVHSAELTFKGKVPIIHDKRLRECNYGKYNAKPSAIVEPMQEKNIITRFPEGESYEDVKSRINDFLESLKKKYDGKHIALVAHKAPQLALDVLLKNKTWEQAFLEDWRKRKGWQPGWEYTLA